MLFVYCIYTMHDKTNKEQEVEENLLHSFTTKKCR